METIFISVDIISGAISLQFGSGIERGPNNFWTILLVLLFL